MLQVKRYLRIIRDVQDKIQTGDRKCDLKSSLRSYMSDIPEALVEILINEIWEFNHYEQAISQLESEHIQRLEDSAMDRKHGDM
jgi:hypothetical protein